MPYDRVKAAAYAQQWAYSRNPKYYNFDNVGGDCTSFISQCLYAGCGVMNYTRDTGWYYRSANDRAAAWSGVEFLHKFLTLNKGRGPYAVPRPLKYAQVGDVIQLSFDGSSFSHSLFVTDTADGIRVATHTQDAYDRPLYTYVYHTARLLSIEGARD